MEEENTPLATVINRIAIGISFGAGLIALFFTIWALVSGLVQPAIGTMVFQCMAWMASVFLLMVVVIKKREI